MGAAQIGIVDDIDIARLGGGGDTGFDPLNQRGG